jgi:hypothetical protein
MKAVAHDQFFANHQSAFWNFIERLIHRTPSLAEQIELEKQADGDLFSGLKFFEDEDSFDNYVRGFRD